MRHRLERRAERGNYAIEFALLLPLLILLSGGVVDTAYYLSAKQALVGAVQDGARNAASYDHRSGAVGDTITQGVAAAQEAWDASGRWEGVTFTGSNTTVGGGGSVPGTTIVSIGGQVTIDTFFDTVGFPSTLTYTHSMRLDYQ